MATLARRLGFLDVFLILIGSVIGSGIFRTPSVVAQLLPAESLMLGAWIAGGILALLGACVLGELAARRPNGCGAYAYLHDAFHPLVAFAFGWSSLLLSLSGGIAAAAVLFAGYFEPLTGLRTNATAVAVAAIAGLTVVNFFGVRFGAAAQNVLLLLKVAGIAAIIVAGFVVAPLAVHGFASPIPPHANVPALVGVAMIPVLFSYNGAVVATYMTTETKRSGRVFPYGLFAGMVAVMALYVLVNAACLRVLGAAGLAKTATPASDILHLGGGAAGERLVAIAIAVSTLGFIGNRILTAPRLYQAMAADGLFFRQIAAIDPTTRVPIVAIALQGIFAIAIAVSGTYEHILNYVVATSYVFTGLLAVALFVVRARDRAGGYAAQCGFRIPGHPVSTAMSP